MPQQPRAKRSITKLPFCQAVPLKNQCPPQRGGNEEAPAEGRARRKGRGNICLKFKQKVVAVSPFFFLYRAHTTKVNSKTSFSKVQADNFLRTLETRQMQRHRYTDTAGNTTATDTKQ